MLGRLCMCHLRLTEAPRRRRRYQDPIVTQVERRLELYTHMNISHQEDLQILRYSDGEKCAPPCSCSDSRLLPALDRFARVPRLHRSSRWHGLVG